jgi:CheY-like chemotaxis protein
VRPVPVLAYTAPPVPSPLRVLIVDDNADIRENLSEILAEDGYACATAPDADAALKRLRAERQAPSVILLDLRMPGMPAPRFVSLLKANPAWSRIPVVLVTAASPHDIPAALRVDVHDVLAKPFDLATLFETVCSAAASAEGEAAA